MSLETLDLLIKKAFLHVACPYYLHFKAGSRLCGDSIYESITQYVATYNTPHDGNEWHDYSVSCLKNMVSWLGFHLTAQRISMSIFAET